MTDRPLVQLNFKVGNAMVNLYADSTEEAESLLSWADETGDAIIKVQTALDATHAATAGVGAKPQGSWQQEPSRASAPTGGAAPCDHGARIYKTGTNNTTGKSWAGWFCPSNVKDCKPVWSKG